MRRREFMRLVGGAAALWPLAARAQQAQRLIGVLMNSASDDPDYQSRLAMFITRMHELGWDDGRNMRIEIRWATRDPDRLMAEAQRLVELQPNVIIATNTLTTQLLRKQTGTVPIVFAGASDPLANGLVESVAHPGGNVTGFSNFEFSVGAKWLELLKQVAPQVKRVLVMMQPNNDGNRGLMRAIETAANSFSVQLSKIDENDAAALERNVPTFASEPDSGLIVLPNPPAMRNLILALAIRYKIPGVYPLRQLARAGGLLSYDVDYQELYRGAANYADRILRGEKPSDLPVQAPTKFDLAINLKTAKALDLTVPQTLLVAADEVIE